MQKIYYLDDDMDDIEIFTEAIKIIKEKDVVNLEFKAFENGDNFLQEVNSGKVTDGALFLDINMPGKSGFQVLTELRKNPALTNFHVIMFSTSSDVKSIKISRELGANLYAVKPNTFSEMNAILRKVLGINWGNYRSSEDNFVVNAY